MSELLGSDRFLVELQLFMTQIYSTVMIVALHRRE